jgi:Mlc titration factor MtfA (ptsG expression regulator)
MEIAFLALLFIGLMSLVFLRKKRKKNVDPDSKFPIAWRKILLQKVAFYNALAQNEKAVFEFRVQEFLVNHKVTGINTEVDITDRLLVACSAIIPVFAFPKWHYDNLFEVLIYPNSFNENFETAGEERRILGMVGTGYMDGKMILSRKALRQGFENESDKRNTAIHEFVHLIDKMDGKIDGIPKVLLEKQYSIPWIELISKKMDEIYEQRSDINPYGGTNHQEFFAVASEYFFERPKLLSKKHPELYKLLEEIFNHEMDARDLRTIGKDMGRNDPCLCGSGKKYKHCCDLL